MTLKLILFKLSSYKTYQWVLLSVPIPGKLTPELLFEGMFHPLVNHGERQYSDGKGNHINGLEGFWGYLK